MKKLFSFLMMVALATSLFAWDGDGGLPLPVRVWSDPVIYNYDEQVTWYYDVSSASAEQLDGATFAIWVWQPGDVPDRGLYGNEEDATLADVAPKMILKNEGNNVFSFTLIPTEFFDKTQDEILANTEGGFWQHLRLFKDDICVTNCGSFPILFPHQLLLGTQGLANNAVAEHGSVNEPVVSIAYPSIINATTPIAFIFNNDEAGEDLSEVPSLHFVSGLNGWTHKVDYEWPSEANPNAPDLSKCSQYFGEAYKDFYVFNVTNPSAYYGVNYDAEILDIQYLFTPFAWASPVVYEGEWEFTSADPWQVETGVKNVIVSSKAVSAFVKDNVLNVNAPSFDLYNVAGVHVAKSTTSQLGVADLAPGVYIVKTVNGSVKVVK